MLGPAALVLEEVRGEIQSAADIVDGTAVD